jgi:hypothetical protein
LGRLFLSITLLHQIQELLVRFFHHYFVLFHMSGNSWTSSNLPLILRVQELLVRCPQYHAGLFFLGQDLPCPHGPQLLLLQIQKQEAFILINWFYVRFSWWDLVIFSSLLGRFLTNTLECLQFLPYV